MGTSDAPVDARGTPAVPSICPSLGRPCFAQSLSQRLACRLRDYESPGDRQWSQMDRGGSDHGIIRVKRRLRGSSSGCTGQVSCCRVPFLHQTGARAALEDPRDRSFSDTTPITVRFD